MKTKRSIYSLLPALLLTAALHAQDIHFSQFTLSPLTLNPALAGAQYDLQGVINYKDQWQSVSTPYRTFGVSYDMRFSKDKEKKGFMAGGINLFSDKAGDGKMGTSQANFSLAYHVRLNDKSTLGGGLQAGFAQRSITTANLSWGNQYDGSAYNPALPSREPGPGNAFGYADLSGGIVWNYDNKSGASKVTDNHDQKFNVGLSVFHVTQPKYSFYATTEEKLYMKYVAHGSGLFSIDNSNVAIAPGFMYARQGAAQEIFAGGLIRYVLSQDSKYTGFKQGAALSAGAYLRAKDALAAMLLLEYSNYAIGISYDINTSPLRAASNSRGGIEITLRFVSPSPFPAMNVGKYN